MAATNRPTDQAYIPLGSFSVTPTQAQSKLAIMGRWPKRPVNWPREDAASDFFVVASFAGLDKTTFDKAIAEYLA